MPETKHLRLSDFAIPLILALVFWIIAIVLWRTSGKTFYLFSFGYIGLAVSLGVGVYTALPRRRRHWGRRLAQFLVGSYMLIFLGLVQRENMQIEGFFFYLLSGLFAGSVVHYLVAKVVGPLIFNRGWCGWSCWTAMLLDLLPYQRSPKSGLAEKWGLIRYAHFFLSLALVLILWLGAGHRVESQSLTELYWLLGGNVLYYLSAGIMAFALRDNRSFCKVLCPIPCLQKLPSRYALLKISGDANKCTDCGLCSRACPMDINVSEYIRSNQRVLSSECILCLECVDACPKGVLNATFKIDTIRNKLPTTDTERAS